VWSSKPPRGKEHDVSQEAIEVFASEWAEAGRVIGHRAGGSINVGWHCSDRICLEGAGARAALLWEDHEGRERSYTYDDIRVLSNSVASFLEDLGVERGERV
jgi:hypothetical protein